MSKLRWKKEERETGLRSVGCDPLKRSSWLHDGSTRYACVSSLGYRALSRSDGWYWVAGWNSGIPHKNTCDTPVATEAEAKAQAMAYVREELAKATKEQAMTNDNQDALRCADTMECENRHGAAAHLRRLVAENEAQDALLRQAVGALESGYWKQKAVNAIRQHLEGRA